MLEHGEPLPFAKLWEALPLVSSGSEELRLGLRRRFASGEAMAADTG